MTKDHHNNQKKIVMSIKNSTLPIEEEELETESLLFNS